jgi:hypothetical protein
MFCPHCGNEVGEGQAFCQHCGLRLGEPAPVLGGREKTPWENRETHGFFGGLFKTLKLVLFNPTEFFRKMPVTGGLTDPLLYALIVGMVGLMFSYVWQILLQGSMQGFMPPEMASRYQMFQQFNIAALAISTPVILIFALFVIAGIFHVLLMLVKGARSGYEATFRVVSYCASPLIFHMVPCCGGLVWLLWSLVISIIGLKEAHETTGGKAAFSVLFPLVLCCGLAVLFIMMFIGAMAASFGAMHQ